MYILFIAEEVLTTSTPALMKNAPKQKLDFGTLSPLEQPASHIGVPGNDSVLDSISRFHSLNQGRRAMV